MRGGKGSWRLRWRVENEPGFGSWKVSTVRLYSSALRRHELVLRAYGNLLPTHSAGTLVEGFRAKQDEELALWERQLLHVAAKRILSIDRVQK